MLTRLLIVVFLTLAPAAAFADRADDVRDYIVGELREDGYSDIRMSRTLLGRMRFVALRHDARREIVVNPRTGEILRDYVQFLASGSGGSGSGSYGPVYDDDDDDDDNSGSGSSNSGSGSNNSGSGSNNSGSGSNNSGSGSSSSGSGSSGSGSDDDD